MSKLGFILTIITISIKGISNFFIWLFL